MLFRSEPKVLNLRVEDLVDDRIIRSLDEGGVIARLYNSYEAK